MKALCIESIGEYKAGVTYNTCPVLCGYQVSSDTERSFHDCDISTVRVFLDDEFKNHFKSA